MELKPYPFGEYDDRGATIGMKYDNTLFLHEMVVDLEKEEIISSISYPLEGDEENKVFYVLHPETKERLWIITAEQYMEQLYKMWPEYRNDFYTKKVK